MALEFSSQSGACGPGYINDHTPKQGAQTGFFEKAQARIRLIVSSKMMAPEGNSQDPGRNVVDFGRKSQGELRLREKADFVEQLYSLDRSASREKDQLTSVRTLTVGGEAKLWLLRRVKDKKLVICKAIPHRTKQRRAPIEVQILQDLLPRHDRIIQLRDWVSTAKSSQLYFDYFDGGDLFELAYQYHRHRKQIPESFLWHIFLQLCEAVAWMHHGYDPRRPKTKQRPNWRKIIHRDLKPANILLRLPPKFVGKTLYPSLVVADFGLASLHETDDQITGTPEFQPPELPRASREADVWAVGAIMHYLILGGHAPIRKMPRGYKGDFEDWCCEPTARQLFRLQDRCSMGLALCVYGALKLDPEMRWNSIRLLDSVLGSQTRAKCLNEDWKPLPDWAFSGDPGIINK